MSESAREQRCRSDEGWVPCPRGDRSARASTSVSMGGCSHNSYVCSPPAGAPCHSHVIRLLRAMCCVRVVSSSSCGVWVLCEVGEVASEERGEASRSGRRIRSVVRP